MAGRTIRVLHVITRLNIGGAAGFVLDICRLMDPLLFECAVLSGPEPAEEGSLAGLAGEQGVPVFRAPHLGRAPHPMRDLRAAREIGTALADWRPHVVHTHTAKAGLLGRWAAARAGVPAVHHIHGWAFLGEPGRLARSGYLCGERWAARRCRRLLAVCEYDLREGLRLGIGVRDQYRAVPAGIDVDEVTRAGEGPDPELAALREQHPLVGFCGRLSRQKDPLAFVEAAHLVREEIGDRVGFVIVGDGPLRSAVDERIGALGLTGHVRRYGLRTDIPRVLSGLDVFVHPSRYEGLPRAILEAFALGVPVVCTGVGGCPEIARDRETALVVPVGDAVALAHGIAEILTNRELAARLCAEARAVVPAYDIRRSAEVLAGVYAELAGPQ